MRRNGREAAQDSSGESATEVHGKLVFGTPKSHEERTVILPRFVIDDVAELLSEPDELVFMAPRVAPCATRTSASAYGSRRWLPRGCRRILYCMTSVILRQH